MNLLQKLFGQGNNESEDEDIAALEKHENREREHKEKSQIKKIKPRKMIKTIVPKRFLKRPSSVMYNPCMDERGCCRHKNRNMKF